MVRYDIDESELEQRIEVEKPGWLLRAAERTDGFRAAGEYGESGGIWSEVKGAYMAIQHNKCAFCERELEGEAFGKIEHDVEHYRPKRNARGWPTDAIKEARAIGFDFPRGDELPEGYFLLAYHPLNYITACKACNSALKSDYFPVAAARISGMDHPRDYRGEEPYLPYPLGSGDIDPERIFTFEGIIPIPVNRSGKKHRRALVTIAFFELATRETLLRQRADLIVSFSRAYADSVEGRTARIRARGQKDVERMTEVTSPHANCLRAFRRVCESDPDRANTILDAVYAYLDALGGDGH
ncbi:MAG: hypothetical protein R3F11_11605 [Verrucomicrobiales bacterium]